MITKGYGQHATTLTRGFGRMPASGSDLGLGVIADAAILSATAWRFVAVVTDILSVASATLQRSVDVLMALVICKNTPVRSIDIVTPERSVEEA